MKTIVTYMNAGTKYTHVFEGHHYGKDYAQLALLKLGIGCSKVLSVEHL